MRKSAIQLTALIFLAASPLVRADDAPALAPVAARITDEVIYADDMTYQAVQARIAALNANGVRVSNYGLAKAQCWLDVSFHEYTRNDRSDFPNNALQQSVHLVSQMEHGQAPDHATPEFGTKRLRQDLWDRLATLESANGFQCAQQAVACGEVELVHSANEYDQFGWRHAKPYIQMAEDAVDDATRLGATCGAAPVPAPAVIAVVPGTLERVTLSADALFDFNRSDLGHLKPEGRAQLDRLASKIRSGYAEVDSITLIGYADRLNNTRDIHYNEKLSLARANTVKGYLARLGIEPALIRTSGKGDAVPIVQCPLASSKQSAALIACLAPNRRVEVVITGTHKPATAPRAP